MAGGVPRRPGWGGGCRPCRRARGRSFPCSRGTAVTHGVGRWSGWGVTQHRIGCGLKSRSGRTGWRPALSQTRVPERFCPGPWRFRTRGLRGRLCFFVGGSLEGRPPASRQWRCHSGSVWPLRRAAGWGRRSPRRPLCGLGSRSLLGRMSASRLRRALFKPEREFKVLHIMQTSFVSC